MSFDIVLPASRAAQESKGPTLQTNEPGKKFRLDPADAARYTPPMHSPLPLMAAAGLVVTVILFFVMARARGVTTSRPLDGVAIPQDPPTMDQVHRLIGDKQSIAAIKLYRELTGVGLKEAKDAVELMAAGGTPGAPAAAAPAPLDPYGPQAQELVTLIKADRLIDAIKLYRSLYGCDLSEAKSAVDKLAAIVRRGAA